MPHSTRRHKVKTYSSKLVHLPSEEGWTTVGREHDRSRASQLELPQARGQLHERLSLAQFVALRGHEPERRRRPVVHTVAEIEKRFLRIQAHWNTSHASASTKEIIRGQFNGKSCDAVEKAICLGLGSLSGWVTNGRSLWQLAAFLDIVRLIEAINGEGRHVSLYAQDPAFDEVDKDFLSTLNIEVLDSPEGFRRIDERSFVFAPHLPLAYWSESMRQGQAGLIVGNSLEEGLKHVHTEEEILSIFRSSLRLDGPLKHTSLVGGSPPIPDLAMKEQLEHFESTQVAVRFPETIEAQEVPFNDLRFYWSKDLNDNQDSARYLHVLESKEHCSAKPPTPSLTQPLHQARIMSFLRHPLFSLAGNLSALGGATYYLHTWHAYNLEEHEARMDELEGTLRGHIGYIEESLDRLEGKGTEADRGKKIDDLYGKRGRDEKEKS